MSKAAAIVAVLVSSWLVLAYSVPTEVGCGETYDPNAEPKYAANVNTIIESMRVSTASAPDRVFTAYLTGPNVYGRSACSADASVTQCTACLTLAVNDMRNICGTTRGGSGSRPVCNMEYGPY
ncbi:antifungal protein ginkbilobin-2-like [Asparagus officinalis]|uniref:antifungal protein ginkbilobin-2-like n=1 Tax=Asparagus officinalis TaxID=4686 RepID=UPI00098DE3B7|nr:antifungal protein ginkbilobin-2-like [Asparagus officinalis]